MGCKGKMGKLSYDVSWSTKDPCELVSDLIVKRDFHCPSMAPVHSTHCITITCRLLSLPRCGHPEVGGSSDWQPLDWHVPIPGQCHRAWSGSILQRLPVGPRACIRCPAALDHPRWGRQPGQAHQRPAPPPPHWRGGEDTGHHGRQSSGKPYWQRESVLSSSELSHLESQVGYLG